MSLDANLNPHILSAADAIVRNSADGQSPPFSLIDYSGNGQLSPASYEWAGRWRPFHLQQTFLQGTFKCNSPYPQEPKPNIFPQMKWNTTV
jgi:hypothetical protein